MVRNLFRRFTTQGRLEAAKKQKEKASKVLGSGLVSTREHARKILDAVKEKERAQSKITKLKKN